MKRGNDYERREKERNGEGKLVGKSKRACGGHANHKTRGETKNLIKPSWPAGARSSVQAEGGGGGEDRA